MCVLMGRGGVMAPSGAETLTGVKPSCFGRIRCEDGECMPTTAAATAVSDTWSVQCIIHSQQCCYNAVSTEI